MRVEKNFLNTPARVRKSVEGGLRGGVFVEIFEQEVVVRKTLYMDLGGTVVDQTAQGVDVFPFCFQDARDGVAAAMAVAQDQKFCHERGLLNILIRLKPLSLIFARQPFPFRHFRATSPGRGSLS